LRRAGEYLLYPEFSHSPSKLGETSITRQCAKVPRGLEDAVAVTVDGQEGYPMALDDPLQEEEIAKGILLFVKPGVGDSAGGIIHGQEQCDQRPTIFKPGMGAPIDLHQHSLLTHALSADPVPWRPT